MRISDWSTDVCSSDLQAGGQAVNADANAGGTASKAELRTLAQRERILCAAQKCFVEHGFHAASMASIAETAEMSAGLIYRYFENKNAIILAIVERRSEEHTSELQSLMRISYAVFCFTKNTITHFS